MFHVPNNRCNSNQKHTQPYIRNACLLLIRVFNFRLRREPASISADDIVARGYTNIAAAMFLYMEDFLYHL